MLELQHAQRVEILAHNNNRSQRTTKMKTALCQGGRKWKSAPDSAEFEIIQFRNKRSNLSPTLRHRNVPGTHLTKLRGLFHRVHATHSFVHQALVTKSVEMAASGENKRRVWGGGLHVLQGSVLRGCYTPVFDRQRYLRVHVHL